jgi:hypothetical protein
MRCIKYSNAMNLTSIHPIYMHARQSYIYTTYIYTTMSCWRVTCNSHLPSHPSHAPANAIRGRPVPPPGSPDTSSVFVPPSLVGLSLMLYPSLDSG